MNKEVNRINYGVIDVARFIMSILVIAIHVDTFYPIEEEFGSVLFRDITGIAVPFFFVTSGFFFRGKSESHSLKYILKLLKAYVCYTVVYLPLTVLYYYKQGMSFPASIFQFTKRFLFVGENFYSFQLWYLPALMCSVMLYLFGTKICTRFKWNTNIIVLISVLFFIAGRAITFLGSGQIELSLLTSLAELYLRIFVTTRNGLFYGFAFFMVGVWISDNTCRLGDCKIVVLLALMLCSACMNHFGLFFMMIPEIACLWIMLQRASNAIAVPNSGNFRKTSELNYYIHLLPLSVMSLTVERLSFWSGLTLAALITVVITTMMVYIGSRARIKDICGDKI